MPKYKCPKCGTVYDEAPRFCSTCGVEFYPPKVKEEPVKLEEQPAPAPAPVVEKVEPEPVKQEPAPQPAPAPAPAPAQQEVVVQQQPAQQQGTPIVVVVQQPVQQQAAPAPAPAQQQPQEQMGEPFNLEDAQEKRKDRINPRTIVGFVFMFFVLALTAVAIMDIFAYGFTDVMLRSIVGVGASVATFIFAIVTLAVTGSVKKTPRLKAMAVLAKIFGIICLILSIFLTIFWVLALICSFMDFDIFGYNLKTFIENLLLYGQFSF